MPASKRIFLLLVFVFFSHTFKAQTFTDIKAGLTGVAESSSCWMDTDRDGDPDVLVAGEFYQTSQPGISTKHYSNLRNDQFRLTGKGLPDFYRGDFSIGDADLDGINDLAIVGEAANGKRLATIYKGTASGNFVPTSVRFMAVRDGSIDFGDVDGDGDLDILLCGEHESGVVTVVYVNNRNFNFQEMTTALPGVRRGVARWSDFNLDGLPDIFLCGISSTGGLISQLFQNHGSSYRKHSAVFTPLKNCNMSFGDMDNDGDDDVVFLGETAAGAHLTQLYRNNRNGFTAVSGGFVHVSDGFADWGDMDLDGDLDLLLSGMSASGPVSRIYSNERNNRFRDIRAGIIPLYNSSGEWGDYDLDGDLDVLIAGLSVNQDMVARIYNNGVISKKAAVKTKTQSSNWETISPVPTRQEPIYYYVYSSSYSDLYKTGKKSYYVFMSPVKRFPKDYVLEEKFQSLLIESFPNWPRTDQGNIVQNGFVTKAEADKSRARMIHEYQTKGFKLIEINW